MLEQHAVDKVVVPRNLLYPSNYHFGMEVLRKAKEEVGDVAGTQPFVEDPADSCWVHSKIPTLFLFRRPPLVLTD